jgi:hypothetical protein
MVKNHNGTPAHGQKSQWNPSTWSIITMEPQHMVNNHNGTPAHGQKSQWNPSTWSIITMEPQHMVEQLVERNARRARDSSSNRQKSTFQLADYTIDSRPDNVRSVPARKYVLTYDVRTLGAPPFRVACCRAYVLRSNSSTYTSTRGRYEVPVHLPSFFLATYVSTSK